MCCDFLADSCDVAQGLVPSCEMVTKTSLSQERVWYGPLVVLKRQFFMRLFSSGLSNCILVAPQMALTNSGLPANQMPSISLGGIVTGRVVRNDEAVHLKQT